MEEGVFEECVSDDDSVASGIDLMNQQLALPGEIRSTAAVEFSSTEMPEHFRLLSSNTNLNDPPSGWLYGRRHWESCIHKVSMCRQNAFSSFKMMHRNPDQMCDIDVVSDSENIKKLLKMPYSKSSVSMIVHRVGNTLMLDKFDVYQYLLRKQESDWAWLKAFVQQVVESSGDDRMMKQLVVRQNKSDESQRMFSKFLYYSTLEESKPNFTSSDICSHSLGQVSAGQSESSNDTSDLSEPMNDPKLALADHQRTVLWAFENLNMLIGTDLPIFGGGLRPCVSLKLRDSSKPINVLTGIDYWLDNLMCNVPEVAMCYHHNGIVQNYEILKTEDIPNLENSRFNPVVIKDIAQNILSFLKSNATKEGHTYWLFKGQNDDIVKLYDLTTLCEPEMNDGGSNPYTVPVGILLYRVARSMWISRNGRSKSRIIRALLNSCLELLDLKEHTQVVTSAHFILSDLYVSDSDMYESTESTLSDSDESDLTSDIVDDDEDNDDDDDVETSSASVEVAALSIPGAVKKCNKSDDMLHRYPPITGDRDERAGESLTHIAKGLQSLVSCEALSPDSSRKYVVETQEQCDPNVAIPLGYMPLNPNKSDSEKYNFPSSNELTPQYCAGSSVAVASSPEVEQLQWITASKVLLLRKAAIVYHTIARLKIKKKKFGVALRYTVLALQYFVSMKLLSASKAQENRSLLGMLMSLAGEINATIYHDSERLEEWRQEFVTCHVIGDETLLMAAEDCLEKFDYPWLLVFPASLNECVLNSARCLRVARELLVGNSNISEESVSSVTKHLGNVLNELGVHYMKSAQCLINEIAGLESNDQNTDSRTEELKKIWERSEASLREGISAFKSLSDGMNLALLHSNLGRLYRLCAQSVPYLPCRDTAGKSTAQSSSRREVTPQEKSYYLQAAASYKLAFEALDSKSEHGNLWESIGWEISSVYFSLATLMQDYSPLSTMAQQTIEHEICEYMKQAMRYCDSKTSSSHQVIVTQYRAATIQHRLASLHHNAMRNESNDQKRKECRIQAETCYAEASRLFVVLESPLELLRVQLERATLFDFILSNQTSNHTRIKTLISILQVLLECRPAMTWLGTQFSEQSDQDSDVKNKQDAIKLTAIVESKLQTTLQLLCKYMSTADKKRGTDQEAVAHCKSMYAASLSKLANQDASVVECCHHVAKVLDRINTEYQLLPAAFTNTT